jgi:hypothetical protein
MTLRLRHRSNSTRRVRTALLSGAGGMLVVAATLPIMGSTTARAETAPTSVTYLETGEHPFVVPAGVTSIHVVAVGKTGDAGNGTLAGAGGDGAMVTADVAVSPGSTVYAEVNIGGAIGGHGTDTSSPAPTGGTGGGGSDLRTCSSTTCEPSVLNDPRLLVAGGGGGGAPGNPIPPPKAPGFTLVVTSAGGAAGQGTVPCSSGNAGVAGPDSTAADQGGGGTCSNGGAAGTTSNENFDGARGDIVDGGAGGKNSTYGGGGGGGGFFGGGGGAADFGGETNLASGAGGGGSSCAPCVHTLATSAGPASAGIQLVSARHATSVSTLTVSNAAIVAAGGAAPRVTISYVLPASSPTATPAPTAGPGTPNTGAGPLMAGPVQPMLIAGGLVLIAIALALGRGRRTGRRDIP